MPVVMVLGGLGTGENNIRDITDAGNNIIAGYDWPMPVEAPKDASILLHAREFYDRAMIAPAQIASAIDWIAAQPWADGNRVSLLGYSMGALVAPAAQNLTLQTGHIVGWTILAYGGAPLSSIFVADEHIKPFWMRYALAPFVSVFLHPLEPALNLSNLTGRFLILEGKNDELVPESARARLRDAVPEPKTIVTFDGEHMGVGPDKAELLQKIIAASREWLLRMDAVNPL
jgi:pimeloyl-ACP methyl ester carboxylesterase